jgi:uncharacterized protein (DUF736 family)
LQPRGCGRRQAGFETSIEAAIGAAEINERRLNMATIGTFTKTNDGFTGTIQTVGLKAKVAIAPVEKRGDSAPDYRVYVGKVEIGAGWARTSKGGREFVSLKLDDPSFPAPIYANLIERDGQHELIWSR